MKTIAAIASIAFLGTPLLPTNQLLAGTFEKRLNNGTATCKQFCANGFAWPSPHFGANGSMGACVSGLVTHNNNTIRCNDEVGLVPSGQVKCTCSFGTDALPIRATSTNRVGDGWRMHTSITMSENGRLDGKTKLKSTNVLGFTGGVEIIFLDKDTNIIHKIKDDKGVNGQAFSPGRATIQHDVPLLPANVTNNVAGIFIDHFHAPRPGETTVNMIKKAVDDGVEIFTK